ncbi:MAG: hypothetical protein N2Z72_07940 [Bacteroidales bacterium]|nr:hypothetical protein [Bacteroidales bacterium]
MKKYLILIFAAMILVAACKKDDKNEEQLRSTQDFAVAENLFGDVFKQSSDAVIKAQDSASGKKSCHETMATCATITITPFDLTTFPKTIIIDFGTINCLCNDGVYRRGKINIVTTGWLRDSGTVITITPDQYYVNDWLVTGQKVIINKGRNSSGNMNFDVSVTGTVTSSDGTIHWTSQRNHEWIEGEPTVFNRWDDVFLIRGEGHGTNIHGENFDVYITSPLKVAANCRWIKSGVLRLITADYTIDVDYGNGTCDGTVVITINGNNYNYVIP